MSKKKVGLDALSEHEFKESMQETEGAFRHLGQAWRHLNRYIKKKCIQGCTEELLQIEVAARNARRQFEKAVDDCSDHGKHFR